MFLLDTNVISELGRKRADPQVIQWVDRQPVGALYLSVITVIEAVTGILKKEAQDPQAGERLRRWWEQELLAQFAERVLPITTDVAYQCAAIHSRRTVDRHDALIAGTALRHRLTVATRNTRHFADIVPTVNPWQ